jgi:hypothetical protein
MQSRSPTARGRLPLTLTREEGVRACGTWKAWNCKRERTHTVKTPSGPNRGPGTISSPKRMARGTARRGLAAISGVLLMLSSAVAFRTGLPRGPPASSPAQCSPAGPRVDLPGQPPRSPPPAPGLVGLPHPRHARAAQKIQALAKTVAKIKQELNRRDMFKASILKRPL